MRLGETEKATLFIEATAPSSTPESGWKTNARFELQANGAARRERNKG